jgi:asparagine synthase (glutamine-hydrolysing)
MSGIAGIVRFDGQDVARRDLERMANALRAHGPDRSEITAAGTIGLVHVLMRMTPEDRFDRQPWRGASGAMIAADLRLDNRDDLLTRLGSVVPTEAKDWPDSRILLTAWERFGENIWPTLRGPFAVAIWEPRQRTLTLARDHLGLNVVMWHRNERFFAFSTMPNGLFALGDVPRRLNEEKFADFLVLNHRDHATTVYQDVYRVPPAHLMTVQHTGAINQRFYWSPSDIGPIRLGSDQAYAEGLRECLDRAVRRQMRSAHPIGCYLSGGLDSSSVAVLVARALGEKNKRLAAFTHVPREGFDGPVPSGRYADEAPYVEAICRIAGNIDVTYLRNNECDDWTELERYFVALEGPIRNPTNLGWGLAIPRLARAHGYRVLLGGFHGNYTISWDGWAQTATHLTHGRLITAFRQWRLCYRNTSYSRWMALRKLIIEPLLSEKLGNWADRRRPKQVAPWEDHSPIRLDFAAQMRVDARARQIGHDFLYRMAPSEQIVGLRAVDHTGDCFAAHRALTGVEIRDPTADVDVASYCFGVPPEQYLAEGIDRSLIRRAMWGLLPEIVTTNRLNGLQSADWYEKLGRRREILTNEIAELSYSPLARRAIDLDRLRRALRTWPTGGWHTDAVINEYHMALTRGVAGARFLRWLESANR